MKLWIRLMASILTLLGAALVTLVCLAVREELYPDEGKIWNSLESSLGMLGDPPPDSFSPDFWITGGLGKITSGHVGFADGETWRYAFLSHHLAPGTNGFSIFKGPGETWRLKGTYFCCEIFPAEAQPRNAEEFRAMLEKTKDVVEKTP